MIFNKSEVEIELLKAFENNSEHELLAVLKKNSYLFYDLYSRKYGVQPNFCEVPFGSLHRCDFCWLNDNSDGPEWVLVEIEKPKVKLFKSNNEPTAEFNHAIEQVKSWERYFLQNPAEKSRIFGAVSRFRFVLVVGEKEAWQGVIPAKWRSHHNQTSSIEIRSMNTFFKSQQIYTENPDNLSFEQYPESKTSIELDAYCSGYPYIATWKNNLN